MISKTLKIILTMLSTNLIIILNIYAHIYAQAQRPTPAVGSEYILHLASIGLIVYTYIKLYRNLKS